MLGYQNVTDTMSIKHENERIGQKAFETLTSLVESANNDISMRAGMLMERITDKMTVDLRRYMERFTKSFPTKKSVSLLFTELPKYCYMAKVDLT